MSWDPGNRVEDEKLARCRAATLAIQVVVDRNHIESADSFVRAGF
jgi:hypothetical protein